MCAKYYELNRNMFKKLHLVKVGVLDTASRFALLSVSGLKGEKLIKSKPT